jgi:hypothetical protein
MTACVAILLAAHPCGSFVDVIDLVMRPSSWRHWLDEREVQLVALVRVENFSVAAGRERQELRGLISAFVTAANALEFTGTSAVIFLA